MEEILVSDAHIEGEGVAAADEQSERQRPLIDQANTFVSRFLVSAVAFHDAMVLFHTSAPDIHRMITG